MSVAYKLARWHISHVILVHIFRLTFIFWWKEREAFHRALAQSMRGDVSVPSLIHMSYKGLRRELQDPAVLIPAPLLSTFNISLLLHSSGKTTITHLFYRYSRRDCATSFEPEWRTGHRSGTEQIQVSPISQCSLLEQSAHIWAYITPSNIAWLPVSPYHSLLLPVLMGSIL